MRVFILKKLRRCFRNAGSPAFAYAAADSYYLPEGRYYAAPALPKRRAKNTGSWSAVLGVGFSCFSVSAILQKPPLPVPANVTILQSLPAAHSPHIHGGALAGLPAAEISYAALSDNADNGAAAAARPSGAPMPRTDRVNRSGKGNSVLAQFYNRRPRLVNYDAHYSALAQAAQAGSFTAALAGSAKQAYGVRFQPPRRDRGKYQIALGFQPAPVKKAPPVLPVPQMLAALVNNDKPDILALSYANIPANPVDESPFDRILTDKKPHAGGGRFIPPIGRRDHPWAATALPPAVFTPAQQKCLAEAVYFEARGESLRGQAAIAQVVLNRVRNPAYPDTICNVVYQNVTLYNRCQFSFACDGRRHQVTEPRPWRTAQAIAKAVTAGQIWLADIGSSTHYHAVYVRPHWAGLMDRMERIGSHIFYRTKGGGWS